MFFNDLFKKYQLINLNMPKPKMVKCSKEWEITMEKPEWYGAELNGLIGKEKAEKV